MRLSTRLVLLVSGCLLPILGAQIYSQMDLYAERHEQLGGLALRQAELANSDIASIVDSVRQLGALTAQFPSTRTAGSRCANRLTALRQALTQDRFLALFSPLDGSLLCASDAAPDGVSSAHPNWAADLLTAPDLGVGQVMSDPIQKTRFLPIAVHLPGVGAGDQSRVLLAGLNTDWLEKHLQSSGIDGGPAMARASLIVADRDGNILGRVPGEAGPVRLPLPEWLRPFLGRENPGIETIADPDGHTTIVAYVPNAAPPAGLMIISTLAVPDLTADIDQSTYRDLLVIAAAALIGLMLAWVGGRRFVYQPMEALLRRRENGAKAI